jgi:uncharacterized protein YukE
MTDPIPDINWAGMSLGQKYQMMHSGPGGAAVVPVAEALGKLAPRLQQSARTVQQVLDSVRHSWQGAAASAFTDVMQKSGQWAQQSSSVPQAGGVGMHTYAESYDSTKYAIPNPSELNPLFAASAENQIGSSTLIGPFGPQVNIEAQIKAARDANTTADRVLTAHADSVSHALKFFPTIENAPTLDDGGGGPGAQPHTAPGTPPGGTGRQPGAGGGHPPGAGPGGAGGSKGGAQGGVGGAGGRKGEAGGAQGEAGGGEGASPSGTSAASSYTPPTPPGTNPTGGMNSTGMNSTGGRSGGLGGAGMGGGSTLPDLNAPPPMTIANGGSYGGGLGGRAIGVKPTPPTTRTVTPAPEHAPTGAGELGSSTSGATSSMPGAGMPIGGMNGAGQRREHRNNTYIPSDDPFRVNFGFITPAVLGPDFENYLDDEYDG